MKNALLISLFFFSTFLLKAQEDMPVIWENKLDHKIMFTGTGTEDRGISYAASEKMMTVFKNKTGEVVWSKDFSDIAPKLNKIDELIPFWDANTVFLFDRKMGKDQIACVDLRTGELLWTTNIYQDLSEDVIMYIPEREGFAMTLKDKLVFVKARTGEERWSTSKFKGVVGKTLFTEDGYLVMVNFMPDWISSLFTGFKNQIMKVNIENGDIAWENTYIGRAERKVISKEFLYDLNLENNKIFLRLNGIQVYDYQTGATLWSAAFDFTPEKIVSKPAGTKRFGVYNSVADPVIDGQDVYVLDMTSKKSQYIKKYDLNSGRLLWTSPEVKGGAKAIPNMYLDGDNIVLQIGGRVEAQAYIYKRQTNADGSVTIVEENRIWFPEVKPFGVQAFSAKDGSFVWESERFKKGITNMVFDKGNLIVCSGKALYSIDSKSGNELYEVPVTNGGVGEATLVHMYKGMVVILGEKGISTFNPKDGAVIASGKYKTAELDAYYDDIMMMKTAKADIAAFDLNTCDYLEFKARTGAITTLSTDGNYVYVYEKKVVTKLKTRK
jgi:outer membrane protein assembly factor BamB